MNQWSKKVVLITGGGSGIGKATALKFLENGATVFISDISNDNLEATVKQYENYKESLHTIQADVSKVMDCKKMIDAVIKKEGKLDVLVNSAGISIIGIIEEMTEAQWDQLIDINLKGTFFTSKYAIPKLEKTKGSIINMSSCSGILGGTHEVMYSASKGGIAVLTKALAIELASKKIRVNAVCPGDVETSMLEKNVQECANNDRDAFCKELLSAYPAGKNARFAQPEEIAEIIYFLASPKVGIITGALISADGGFAAGY